jgi:hypothetical protein
MAEIELHQAEPEDFDIDVEGDQGTGNTEVKRESQKEERSRKRTEVHDYEGIDVGEASTVQPGPAGPQRSVEGWILFVTSVHRVHRGRY